MFSRVFMLLVCLLPLLGGCAKNPVTGDRELHLVSQSKEIRMGEENYGFGQQMGGGIYTGDPELTRYVQSVGHKLAKVSNRPDLPFEFVILNDSVPNAWAMPGGKLAINRGLLINLETEAELAAVLGHEITHAAARHSAKAVERQVLLSGTLIAAGIALSTTDNSRLQNQAIMTSGAIAAQMVSTKYSREAELEADSYGMETMVKAGYDPMGAVTLQEKFVKLFDKKSPNWLKGLFASHPPSKDREKANRLHAQKLPSNLELGKESYQKKIAKLKKEKPAYDKFDEATTASSKRKHMEALNLVNEAIKQVPTEGHFYALKGDILASLHQPYDALACYDKAIALQSDYFYYYHQRGLLLAKMGRRKQARIDLERSQRQLPTQHAAAALERLAMA